MLNLFLSFIMAVSGATGLVVLSHIIGFEHYTSRIFPLIPLLYAIIYHTLEKMRTGKTKPISPEKVKPENLKKEMRTGLKKFFMNISGVRIFTAVGISYSIKLVIEIIISLLFIYLTKSSLAEIYGNYVVNIIGVFLRGDHPWLSGIEGLYTLVCISLATSLSTGLWIGFTSKASALIEGVIAGMLITIFTAMTNMLFLYQKIEEMTASMAKSLGYNTSIGFMAVISLQVMLYGFWSGIFQKIKQDRIKRRPNVKKI
ncbi:MAG: hypothetical protein AB1610_00765 [Nitrospirota bacterium]